MKDLERIDRPDQGLQFPIGWTDEDAGRIHGLCPILEPHLPSLVDDFYAEMARHPEAHKVFTGGEARAQRLKRALLAWLAGDDSAVPGVIEVEVDRPADLPPAMADPGQIRIVLGNLIRNTCEAMPSGGRLTLRGRAREDGVVLAVIDAGVGIVPADLDRLTGPLYSTKARGLSLGLALVRMILERNGGSLTVASEPGRGSPFAVRLAIARQGVPTS